MKTAKNTKKVVAFFIALAIMFACIAIPVAVRAAGGGTKVINVTAETYTLTVNEVFQNEDGNEEHTDTNTVTVSGGEVITLTAAAPDGYSVVGDAEQSVTMNDNKAVTFTYKKDVVYAINDYVTMTPLKMRWQGISGSQITKTVGNVTLTYDSKEYGRFGGVALIIVDPTSLPDGKSITISIPQKDINITVGGETLAAKVDFEDVTLTNSDGSRQFMVAAITSRSDLPYNDFVGKTITGSIEVAVDFS